MFNKIVFFGSIFLSYSSSFCMAKRAGGGKCQDSLTQALGESYVPRDSWEVCCEKSNQRARKNAIARDRGKKFITFHHTVVGSLLSKDSIIPPAQEMEAVKFVYKLHVKRWAWHDIGYHFLVGQSGRVFEGRPLNRLGAHTRGNNRHNIGIAFLGCFDDQGAREQMHNPTKVTNAMVTSTARLVACLALNYKFPISKDTVLPRSAYEQVLAKPTIFPFSPGNRVVACMPEIILRAQECAVED